MKIEPWLKGTVVLSDILLAVAFFMAFFQSELARALGFSSAFEFHLATSGIAVMLSLFSNSCIIFYFVGTGVWIKDRAREIVGIDKDRALRVWSLYEKSNKLKGKAFPLPSLNLVLALFTFILGGALQVSAVPHWTHPTLATILIATSILATRITFRCIKDNLALLDQCTAEIDAIPAEG